MASEIMEYMGLKKNPRGVSSLGWSLVSTGWAREMMKRRPQPAQSSRVTRCQFIHVCKVLKSSGSGANVCWFVDRHQTRGWFTTLRLFTLLPIVVEKRAVRMSGRSSSLQPLLSKSLALDLYLACSRKQQNTHTHTHKACHWWETVLILGIICDLKATVIITPILIIAFFGKLFDLKSIFLVIRVRALKLSL